MIYNQIQRKKMSCTRNACAPVSSILYKGLGGVLGLFFELTKIPLTSLSFRTRSNIFPHTFRCYLTCFPTSSHFTITPLPLKWLVNLKTNHN